METNIKKKETSLNIGKKWSTEDESKVMSFFKKIKGPSPTKVQRENISKELNRPYTAIYTKFWTLNGKKGITNKKSTKNNNNAKKDDKIVVTHVNQKVPMFVNTIKIGEVAIIETFSNKIKINDVFIEV